MIGGLHRGGRQRLPFSPLRNQTGSGIVITKKSPGGIIGGQGDGEFRSEFRSEFR
jgi:hypothetical protein